MSLPLPEPYCREFREPCEMFTADQMRAYGDAREAAERERLQAEVEALRKDAERLNWCESQWRDGVHLEVCSVNAGLTHHGLHPETTVYFGAASIKGKTLRAAIDAAMGKSLTPEQRSRLISSGPNAGRVRPLEKP